MTSWPGPPLEGLRRSGAVGFSPVREVVQKGVGKRGCGMVTRVGWFGRIERMIGDTATAGYTHPIVNAVADLEATLDGCADARLWSLSVKELDDLLPRAHALLARITGTLVLPLIREADSRGACQEYDAASTADWVRYLLRVPARQAKQLIGLARAVEGDATATGTALAAGRISAEHAQVIAESLAALPEQAEGWVTDAAEEHLLDAAADHDPKALHRLGRRIVEIIDPDHGDELLRQQLERADRQAEESRELHAVPHEGRVRLTGWLDNEGWQILRTALDPLAAPRPAANGSADGGAGDGGGTGSGGGVSASGDRTGGGNGGGSGGGGEPDTRPYPRRMADALVELADRALRGGDLPTQGGEKPTLVLTLDYAKLAAEVGTGTLDTGEHLPAGTVRRLACDAKIIPAVLGGPSQPLDLGRAQRTVTTALRRALVLRDKGCTFPGCDLPPGWCDAHHLRHWANGGPTDLNNTVLLCPRHHHTARAEVKVLILWCK